MDLEYIRHTTEFQVFDRKSVRIEPKALAVPIIAMANADGGVIALGVEDGVRLRANGVDVRLKRGRIILTCRGPALLLRLMV